jgi:prolipoprotein diacylglyceryltransferase
MLVLMLLRRKNFPQIQFWKYPVVSIFLALAGVIGAMLMAYIETGKFGGTSLFGSIFFIPILLLPVLLLRIPFGTLMDLCAPAECLMLVLMKFDCLLSGCCFGIYIPALELQFPSQIIEMITFFAVMLLLLKLERNEKNQGRIYGYYMLVYGSARFILNWFRYGVKPFVWILPAGNFWSLVAIALGLFWLFLSRKHTKK